MPRILILRRFSMNESTRFTRRAIGCGAATWARGRQIVRGDVGRRRPGSCYLGWSALRILQLRLHQGARRVAQWCRITGRLIRRRRPCNSPRKGGESEPTNRSAGNRSLRRCFDIALHCTKFDRFPHHPRIRDGHGSQARRWPGCAKPAPRTHNRHLMRSVYGAGSEVRAFQERGHFRACALGRMREFNSPAERWSSWYFRQYGYLVGVIETRMRARPDIVTGLD